MRKVRYEAAAVALAGAAAPLAAQPAQAMTCHPDFRIVCVVIGTACRAIDEAPVPDKYDLTCELGR